jgi:hypothetical protein
MMAVMQALSGTEIPPIKIGPMAYVPRSPRLLERSALSVTWGVVFNVTSQQRKYTLVVDPARSEVDLLDVLINAVFVIEAKLNRVEVLLSSYRQVRLRLRCLFLILNRKH